MTNLVIVAVIAFIIGILLTFFILKANLVSRKELENTQREIGVLQNQLSSNETLINERNHQLEKSEMENTDLKEGLKYKELQLANVSADLKSKTEILEEQKLKSQEYEAKIEKLNEWLNQVKAEYSKYEAENHSLREKLETQKKEIEELYEEMRN